MPDIPPSAVRFAQILGLTSSAFLAGSNATYTFVTIPTILTHSPTADSDEKTVISQWRTMYNIGFYATGPQCALTFSTFAFLAYSVRHHAFLRNMYIATALICPSILPFTLTVQRALNGALSLRAEKLVGKGWGTQAERYALENTKAKEMEKAVGTEELVETWAKYNAVRAFIGVVGAAMGAWTCLEHARSGM